MLTLLSLVQLDCLRFADKVNSNGKDISFNQLLLTIALRE